MPLYCSNTGSTALREADVQQPITAAHLSCTRSFFAFSAKVGQSLAPSSWMNLILRPSTPPSALICSMASFSASTDPVSLIAIVPVTECRMPTVTSVSVTAKPVVFTCAVGGASARANCGIIAAADSAAVPMSSPRRGGGRRLPVIFSEDMRRLDSAPVKTTIGASGPRSLNRDCVDLLQCSIRRLTYMPTSNGVSYCELTVGKQPVRSGTTVA